MSKILKWIFDNETAKAMIIGLLAVLLGSIGLDYLAPEIFDKAEEVLSESQPGYYKVIEVNDGDTITVKSGSQSERVRFIGIDTPEKEHPERPVECFAEAASAHLDELIGNEDVRLEADPTNTNRDRYDRLLRYVYLPDGTFLNSRMIEDGYAFAYLNFPFTELENFKALEDQAREANRGLWNSCEILEVDGGQIRTEPAFNQL